jgi:hypothetical protein
MPEALCTVLAIGLRAALFNFNEFWEWVKVNDPKAYRTY